MIPSNKVAIVIGTLSITLVATLSYTFFFQDNAAKDSQDTVVTLSQRSNARNGLVSEIKRINAQITELQKASRSDRQKGIGQRLNTLYRELDLLRNQLNSITKDLAFGVSADAEPTIDDQASDVTQDPMSEEEQLVDYVDQQLALYKDSAMDEGPDREWAPEAQSVLLDAFENLVEDGVGVSEVKCFSTFCEADISLENYSAEAVRKLQQFSPWNGEMTVFIKDLEQGEGVVYLAREGHYLPGYEEDL
ncbi:MAG: hypothetical protein GY927_08620 [bacterium]|nr:hypothetical protein [bacterium]